MSDISQGRDVIGQENEAKIVELLRIMLKQAIYLMDLLPGIESKASGLLFTSFTSLKNIFFAAKSGTAEQNNC
uniref:Uncharacterized protein n=1 Tax=Onchocerca volvulus TaxID=6282 RepID=A0A8R1Y5W8_ONCVO